MGGGYLLSLKPRPEAVILFILLPTTNKIIGMFLFEMYTVFFDGTYLQSLCPALKIRYFKFEPAAFASYGCEYSTN